MDGVYPSCVIKNALGKRGFAGIDMGAYSDISQKFTFFFHLPCSKKSKLIQTDNRLQSLLKLYFQGNGTTKKLKIQTSALRGDYLLSVYMDYLAQKKPSLLF